MAGRDAGWFRGELERFKLTQTGYSRLLLMLGDSRSSPTVLRYVQRMASGETPISPETGVILTLLEHNPRAEMERARKRGRHERLEELIGDLKAPNGPRFVSQRPNQSDDEANKEQIDYLEAKLPREVW